MLPDFFESKLESFDIAEGVDLVPSMDNFDALIVGGSERSVYDGVDWLPEVSRALNECREMEKPIFGICFGHQVMALTFGGEVSRSSPTDCVGVRTFVRKENQKFNRFVWHHDQVTRPPSSANVVASSDYCPYASLEYEFPALSVQYHPEFEKEYFKQLLLLSKNIFLSPEETQSALNELNEIAVPEKAELKQLKNFFYNCVSD